MKSVMDHFHFQWEWSNGKILNVGCDSDPMDFRGKKGAVNLDVVSRHPKLDFVTPVDVIHDVRNPLPGDLQGQFDTVIFGDVIEHMSPEDGMKSIRNLKEALKPGGKLIITCPHDYRDKSLVKKFHEEMGIPADDYFYVEGVTAGHRPVAPLELVKMLEDSGLFIDVWSPLDYGHFLGSGAVCEVLW